MDSAILILGFLTVAGLAMVTLTTVLSADAAAARHYGLAAYYAVLVVVNAVATYVAGSTLLQVLA